MAGKESTSARIFQTRLESAVSRGYEDHDTAALALMMQQDCESRLIAPCRFETRPLTIKHPQRMAGNPDRIQPLQSAQEDDQTVDRGRPCKRDRRSDQIKEAMAMRIAFIGGMLVAG